MLTIELMKPTATLYNVPTVKLKKRLAAYKELYDTPTHTHIVKVKGSFWGRQGQAVMLEHTLTTIDMDRSGLLWLHATVDGEQIEMRAEHDIIDEVQIAVFQK